MTLSVAAAFAAALQFAALHIGPDNHLTREWQWCVGKQATPEQTIQGCSTLINSGREKPDDILVAYLNRGSAYFDIHDYDHAIADFTQAIEMNRSDPYPYLVRGTSYNAKGQYDLAVADFDTAIRLKPDYGVAFYERGVALRGKGDYARAIQDFDQAIRLKPSPAAFNARCRTRAIAAVQLDVALADCNQALSLQTDDYEAMDSRGFVYFRLNQFDKALADYNAVVAAMPTSASALYMRGVVRRRMGDNGGDADIAAAKAIKPAIAETYAKYGVTP
jgi:tetratricopeptide (TPR) repeat protein